MSESSGGPEDLHALLLPAREETPAKINHTARDLSRGPQHEGLGPGSPLIPGYPQKGWHSMQSLWPGNSRAVWAAAPHTASHRLHSRSHPLRSPVISLFIPRSPGLCISNSRQQGDNGPTGSLSNKFFQGDTDQAFAFGGGGVTNNFAKEVRLLTF